MNQKVGPSNWLLWIHSLWSNKVWSMLIHTTHTNPWGKLKWPYPITRLTAHFMCGLMFDLVIWKFRKSMIIHDTECPYWDQVSLNNTQTVEYKLCKNAPIAFFTLLTEWYWFPLSVCPSVVRKRLLQIATPALLVIIFGSFISNIILELLGKMLNGELHDLKHINCLEYPRMGVGK